MEYRRIQFKGLKKAKDLGKKKEDKELKKKSVNFKMLYQKSWW